MAVVSVYALMQIKLLVIPILIALILAAAIGPFVNMLRRRGLPGGRSHGGGVRGPSAPAGGVGTVIYFSVRSQWAELAQQASSGLDELEQFLLNGPIPIEQEQLDQAREGIIQFATSSQVRSGAITGLSVVTEFLAGAILMVVILFFFLKDGAKIWNFFLRPFTGEREAKLRRVRQAHPGGPGRLRPRHRHRGTGGRRGHRRSTADPPGAAGIPAGHHRFHRPRSSRSWEPPWPASLPPWWPSWPTGRWLR